jgi:hypothetical protein
MYETGDLRQSQLDVNKKKKKKYTNSTYYYNLPPPVKVKLQPHTVRFLPKRKSRKHAQLAKRKIQKKIPALFTLLKFSLFFLLVPCRI